MRRQLESLGLTNWLARSAAKSLEALFAVGVVLDRLCAPGSPSAQLGDFSAMFLPMASACTESGWSCMRGTRVNAGIVLEAKQHLVPVVHHQRLPMRHDHARRPSNRCS
jgi:hypothetical protein